MFLWPCRGARRPWPCCCFCKEYMLLSRLPQDMDRCVLLTGMMPLGDVCLNIKFAANAVCDLRHVYQLTS